MTAPVNPQKNDKLRVAGHGLGNTQICARTVRYGSRLVADSNQLVPRESSRTKITSSWNGPSWAEVRTLVTSRTSTKVLV